MEKGLPSVIGDETALMVNGECNAEVIRRDVGSTPST